MKRVARALLGSFFLFTLGCEPFEDVIWDQVPNDKPTDETDKEILLVSGASEKGPFAAGAAVSATLLDENFQPTAQSLVASVNNAAGDYSLSVLVPGLYEVQITGQAYDETTGTLTEGLISLQSLVELGAGQTSSDVNVLTHLIRLRVLELLLQGDSLFGATTSAQQELAQALALAVPDFAFVDPAFEISFDDGDNEASFLFLLSSVLSQASAGDVLVLQILLDQWAEDFRDGLLDESTLQVAQQALEVLDTTTIEAQFDSYAADNGLSFGAPDLDAVADQDGDGIANADDPTPLPFNEPWNCPDSWLEDGFCDCGCGGNDPDCGPASYASAASCDALPSVGDIGDCHGLWAGEGDNLENCAECAFAGLPCNTDLDCNPGGLPDLGTACSSVTGRCFCVQ